MRILKVIGKTLFFSPRGWNYLGGGRGQTLIEVILAVGVTIIFLVSMVGVVTRAIANSQFAKNKAKASQYVQEGLENARALRDQTTDWETFNTTYSDGSQLGWAGGSSAPSGACPATPNIDGIFIRCILFNNDGEDKKKITLTVTWTDGKGTHETKGVTYLTQWD